MRSQTKNYLSLLLWIAVIMLVGWSMGFLTKGNVDSWYVHINRSPLSPPNYLFGIVWSILYLMIAVNGWLIWTFHQNAGVKKLYILQLILNWSWTPLFFYFHETGFAFLDIVCLVCVVLGLTLKLYSFSKTAAFLLVPYLCWISFASYLNLYVWLYN